MIPSQFVSTWHKWNREWEANLLREITSSESDPKIYEYPEGYLSSQEFQSFSKLEEEFNAFGGVLGYELTQFFKEHDEKRYLVEAIGKFLRKGINIPLIHPAIIQAWKTKPTMWRKFQQKMFHLYEELKDQL
jgi:hypothetical protein